MEVVRCPSAAEFLRLTTSYRAVEPIRTNILGSVATSVMNGTQRDDGGSWWLIHAEDGEVVGAAMRTAPFGMQIGPMPDEAAKWARKAEVTDRCLSKHLLASVIS